MKQIMKGTFLAFICAATLVCGFTRAQAANTGNLLRVHTQGIVCSFCAQGVEKHFGKQAAVKHLAISLAHKQILVEEAQGYSLTQAQIEEAIANAGFKVVSVQRFEGDFNAEAAKLKAKE